VISVLNLFRVVSFCLFVGELHRPTLKMCER